jgi:hypothetical protein
MNSTREYILEYILARRGTKGNLIFKSSNPHNTIKLVKGKPVEVKKKVLYPKYGKHTPQILFKSPFIRKFAAFKGFSRREQYKALGFYIPDKTEFIKGKWVRVKTRVTKHRERQTKKKEEIRRAKELIKQLQQTGGKGIPHD